MAGTTPNLGLYLPGGGSTGTWTPDEVADIDPINQNFVSLDTEAGSVRASLKSTQVRVTGVTERDAVFPFPVDGDRVWRTDFDYGQYHDGTKWLTEAGGVQGVRWQTANQSIPDTSPTEATFGSVFVRGGASVSGNGILTPVAGWYDCAFYARWAGNATGQRVANMTINGSNIGAPFSWQMRSPANATNEVMTQAMGPVLLAANDILGLSLNQSSGSALIVNSRILSLRLIQAT